METFQPFLAGEAAIVTGASRGIGRAVALTLACLGADVGLLQRGEAAETRGAVEALARRAVVVRVDLGNAEAAEVAVERAAEELGRLDVCVANHGVIHREPALDVSLDDFRRVIDVNLMGAFAVTRAAARRFVAGGEGRIVHLGSQLSFFGGVNVAAYAASKGAIAQLAKSQANEWASLGIRVNAIAPGWIETEMTKEIREAPTRRSEISARIPLGRWGREEEVAAAVAFLVSPAASYLHGAVLPVDGGYLGR